MDSNQNQPLPPVSPLTPAPTTPASALPAQNEAFNNSGLNQTKSKNSSQRILIIEDEQNLRDLYQEVLATEGYQVETAIDGEEGYQKMLKGGYDLVLLDIKMPKMDGIQILRKLKNEIPPEKPNKSVVILTNFSQDSFISAATEMGVRGFMIKSDYSPDQLISEVERYLETG